MTTYTAQGSSKTLGQIYALDCEEFCNETHVYFSNTYTTYMFDNTIPLRTIKALREYCISLDWI